MGLIWNFPDTSCPWVAELSRITRAHEGNAPRAYTGAWRAAFPVPEFGELIETSMAHGHTGTPEDVIVNRTLSSSVIASLPSDERAFVAERMRAIIDRYELGREVTVTHPYLTKAYVTVRE